VRRDPLAAAANVTWLDHDTEPLSTWDPIHLGVGETGEPIRLSLVERSLLVGGEPGSGKSSLLNLLACHAAKSPDAHLVLIDPNEVQFGPWRDRALHYASDDPRSTRGSPSCAHCPASSARSPRRSPKTTASRSGFSSSTNSPSTPLC